MVPIQSRSFDISIWISTHHQRGASWLFSSRARDWQVLFPVRPWVDLWEMEGFVDICAFLDAFPSHAKEFAEGSAAVW